MEQDGSGSTKATMNTLFADRDISTGDASVESSLNNPLHLGFLLKFCEGQFNSENVRFVIAVDGFRDMVLAHDNTSWRKKTWRELDKIFMSRDRLDLTTSDLPDLRHENEMMHHQHHQGGESKSGDDDNEIKQISRVDNSSQDDYDEFSEKYEWKSRFNKVDFDRAVRYIWNEYLSDLAVNQICLPAHVACKTKIRYELRHAYGPNLFNESCIDPIKTIKRDILPRFVSSQTYQTLENNIKSSYSIMDELQNVIPKTEPRWNTCNVNTANEEKAGDYADDHEFELYEILDSGILFTEFLDFLRAKMCSENLLCVRMIEIYEDIMSQPDKSTQSVEHAWKIYKSFIAPGSMYEISLNQLDRKDVMMRMASPNLVIFESSKKSAYHALRGNYEQYRMSKQFKQLGKILKEKLAIKRAENPNAFVPRSVKVNKDTYARSRNEKQSMSHIGSSKTSEHHPSHKFAYEADSSNKYLACFGK